MFGDGSKAAAIESAIVFPNPSSHSHFHPIPPSYSPIPQSHSHRTLTLPPSTPSKSNSIPAPNQMDDPSPALFITGGLFLEPTIPNSLLNSVVSFKKNSPSSAVVSGAGSSCWCRLRAVAGGGFLSVSLNSDGVVRESKGCLVQNGDESSEETAPAVVTERKREKVGVRSRRAMNTTNHLWAGAIAAMVSRTFVAPLERLKLEYIVRGEQRHLFELVKTIAANQGLRGFWKGNLVNILRTAPFKAINFYAYDTYRKQLLRFSGNKETTNFERFVAGAAAGITAATLCLPLDTVSEFRIRPFDQSLAEMGSFFQIRTQLVAPGGEALGGVIGAFRHMIQTEGFFSLYKGLVPSIASMAPAGAVFYGVYDILKSTYLHSHDGRKRIHKMSQQGRGWSALDQLELGPVRTLLYGAISGACAEAATYPFEVVRRQLQLQVQATKMNALATGIKIVEHGGVPALYAGLIPSLLQVLPSAAISYFVYEFMKIVLKVE